MCLGLVVTKYVWLVTELLTKPESGSYRVIDIVTKYGWQVTDLLTYQSGSYRVIDVLGFGSY